MPWKITCMALLVWVNTCMSQFPHTVDRHTQRVWMYQREAQLSDEASGNHIAEDVVSSLRWTYVKVKSASANLSISCAHDFEKYVEVLVARNRTLWALRMADSTGKMESGVLDGNGIFEGRYIQCRDAMSDVSHRPFEPLYCLSMWFTFLPDSTIPILSRGLGMCIPDTCTDDDAEILLKTVYDPLLIDSRDVAINCVKEEKLNAEAIISITILSLFGILVLLASLYDACVTRVKQSNVSVDIQTLKQKYTVHSETVYHVNPSFCSNEVIGESHGNHKNNNRYDFATTLPESNGVIQSEVEVKEMPKETIEIQAEKETSGTDSKPGIAERILLCFSLYQNVPLIITTAPPSGAIGCLNGLRFIAMSCVILGHTYSTAITLENLNAYYEDVLEPINNKLFTLDLYVDTFFILSALLVSISFLKWLRRCDGRIGLNGLALHYFNRYWRLTPTYFIVLMIYTNLTHYFIVGPFWPDYVSDVDSCSTEWWKNLLYVNNLFLTDGKYCMGWSWYLAVDMQLFVMAPLFLYLLYRWEKLGITAVILGFCGGIIANIVLYEQYYSEGADADDAISEYDDIYIKPWTRCPVYFMGILVGYLFYKTSGKIKMSWYAVAIGWTVAGALYIITAYAPTWSDCSVVECNWTTAGKVTWSTLYRPMWGIWVCWLILACATGYGGVINTFLSWSFFVPLGRLTYLGYLIHLLLITVFYNITPVQFYFTDFFLVYVFFANLLVTNLLSLVMAASVSAPLMKLASVFIPSRGKKDIR